MTPLERQTWFAVWMMMALIIGVANASRPHKRRHDSSEEDDDDDDDDHHKDFWDHVGGIVVIGVVSVVGAALFSLCAWIICSCHERCKKSRVNHTGLVTISSGKHPSSTTPPEWSRRLVVKPELSVGFFGAISDGFYSLSAVQLLRQRPGPDVTDGAKWGAPLISGKHLFEIIWPWGCRGYEATVGVATRDAPVKFNGKKSLVGSDKNSWGLDIVRRRVVVNGRGVKTCPTDGSYVPDKFLMYIDMDEGTVGFGSDVTFWGNVITGLPRGTPIFPMVGSNKYEANIQMFYRGTADVTGFDPYDGNGQSYDLPPLVGPLPPTYSDIYKNSTNTGKGRPESAGLGGRTSSPSGGSRDAWTPEPPPTPSFASAPDLPPAYFSPVPPVE